MKRTDSGVAISAVVALIALTVLATAGVTYWILRSTIYPRPFEPVMLAPVERLQLDQKLRVLGVDWNVASPAEPGRDAGTREPLEREPLEPEPYSEDPEKREISLSERELNGILAHNTDLAHRVAIDLSEDLASAKVLLPMDPDLPLFGGKTLKLNTGLQLAWADGRPVVRLRGVSVMGVPLPNAWLGNLKNVDLVHEFGDTAGFWKSFADGIELIDVREGELFVKLRE
ncbi:MAG: arginine N-succinyltransferase [Myxococcales bacterium]|nr:arginine N-succinyltransferase [Myxococcales bacterium]